MHSSAVVQHSDRTTEPLAALLGPMIASAIIAKNDDERAKKAMKRFTISARNYPLCDLRHIQSAKILVSSRRRK